MVSTQQNSTFGAMGNLMLWFSIAPTLEFCYLFGGYTAVPWSSTFHPQYHVDIMLGFLSVNTLAKTQAIILLSSRLLNLRMLFVI